MPCLSGMSYKRLARPYSSGVDRWMPVSEQLNAVSVFARSAERLTCV